ncbi:MAG: asparagine synthase (glutamine-hydrolyzing) [Candidatus Tectimicrobiota bacterium]
MCGISAIIELSHSQATHLPQLLQMHAMLAHRGPDGEGFLFLEHNLQSRVFTRALGETDVASLAPRLSIGFRRLSIQDRRMVAHQPMTHNRGRQWIVCNGEIYNFKELRQVLTADGYSFATQSDAEVALAAYHRWGTGCFEKFNGMWALLIVDLERGTLLGCRDRLGIKPLFYTVAGGRVFLASEPKALARVQPQGAAVSAYRLIDFLRGSPQQVAAFSFFADIQPVPAATFFEVDLLHSASDELRFQPYWNLADYVADRPVMSFPQAHDALADLLHSAVAYQTRADVPVGSLLSGGLDSSMLARLMTCVPQAPVTPRRVFSLVFDEPEMDESPYIDAVLALGGVEGQRLTLSPTHAWTLIDTVTEAYGEPLLGHYLLAYYCLFALAKSHNTTVLLDGQGADELLGGYNFLEAAALRERWTRGQWKTLYTELRLVARQQHRSPWALFRSYVLGHYKNALRSRLRGPQEGPQYDWLQSNAGPGRLAPRAHAQTPPQESSRDASLLNQQLYRLTKHTNLPYLLLFLDRLSMAHSLELRVPYLDHRLVEFCFQLPASYKIAGGYRKRLLREVARAYLPPLILERTYKMGIASNLHWLPLRPAHGAALREMASSPTLSQLPWLHSARLRQFVEAYLAQQHHDALAVWRLYTVWRWLEIFRPTIRMA